MAKVLEVCPNKGCWLKLELPDGQQATVKMKDYGFFVPLAAKGKTVVIDGTVALKTTPVSELKHFAEDAKKSKAEIDAITPTQKRNQHPCQRYCGGRAINQAFLTNSDLSAIAPNPSILQSMLWSLSTNRIFLTFVPALILCAVPLTGRFLMVTTLSPF
jgi:hypothetical protein